MKKKGISQTRTKKIIDAERQAQTAMEVSKKNDKPKTGIHYGNLPLFSQSIPVFSKANDDEAVESRNKTRPATN